MFDFDRNHLYKRTRVPRLVVANDLTFVALTGTRFVEFRGDALLFLFGLAGVDGCR